jgi:DMSO/TMAO reductase YedYZ molybdopterin-dependent catalytic subunit
VDVADSFIERLSLYETAQGAMIGAGFYNKSNDWYNADGFVLIRFGAILCYGYDTYTTNLSLEEALKPDVLLVHTFEDKPLAQEHGGPVRMITPQLYAWKGAKWIKRIQFLTADQPGFWEERGYSNTAYPWRNDRYS